MSSSMLAGERRWASARRGGMTVLGKVAVPKPLNLPSQKLENHGLDPNVEIVPKGTLSWGSRPSSSGSNPWISSSVSPNAEGGTVSPSHLSGRPSSGGSGTRPSTAGSERTHEAVSSAWGSNSRPSSASGTLSSNQTSSTSLRPKSAENRPNSSQLSRFADPVLKNSAVLCPSATAERLGVKSNKDDAFALSSGDFPTLGSEKDNSMKNTKLEEPGRPRSASARIAHVKVDAMSQTDTKHGAVDTWRADGPRGVDDDIHPRMEKWHGENPPHFNPNASAPQHFNTWRGPPPMNNPAGVWYGGGRPQGPPYGAPTVRPGGFPMEPFPFYRPQIAPPPLAGSQPGPTSGLRGPYPKNGDLYRPQMPDAYAHPGMPFRPGFYPGPPGPPGPMGFEGYYGPPMGYEREIPYMGMAVGPPVHNSSYPAPHVGNSHGRNGLGVHPGKTSSKQGDADRVEDTQGPKRIQMKSHPNQRDHWRDEKETQEHNAQPDVSYTDKNRPHMISSRKNEWGADEDTEQSVHSMTRTRSEKPSQSEYREHAMDGIKVKPFEGKNNSKAVHDNWTNASDSAPSFPAEMPRIILGSEKDPSLLSGSKHSALMHKIDGLNVKVRVADGRNVSPRTHNRGDERNRSQVSDTKINNNLAEVGRSVGSLERTTASRDFASSPHEIAVPVIDKPLEQVTVTSRRPHHGGQGRVDHRGKGKSYNQDSDGWRRKPLTTESSSVTTSSHDESEAHGPDNVEEVVENSVGNPLRKIEKASADSHDSSDIQVQRAKMREIAKQRALQLQKEEEERIREQRAKALAKLEELNRRTLADEAGIETETETETSNKVQKAINDNLGEQDESCAACEVIMDDVNNSNQAKESTVEMSRTSPVESDVTTFPMHEDACDVSVPKDSPQFNDGGISRNKVTSFKQKHSLRKSFAGKPVSNVAMKAPEDHIHVATNDIKPDEHPSEIKSSESNVPNTEESVAEPSMPQRRKNNRSGKNKQKLDGAPLPPVEANVIPGKESKKVETKGSLSNSDSLISKSTEPDKAVEAQERSSSSLPNEESHNRISCQWRPHSSRRQPRNQQQPNNKPHGCDAVWAPVRPQNKAAKGSAEASSDSVQESADPTNGNNHMTQNNSKGKRAEMERYVPKPVAKELAQQGSVPNIPPSIAFARSKDGSNGEVNEGGVNHNKHKKDHGTWKQRGPTDSSHMKGGHIGPSSTYDPVKEIQEPKEIGQSVKGEIDSANAETRTSGTSRGKRNVARGPATIIGNNTDPEITFSGEVDANQTDRTIGSKENRASSRWQPKPTVNAANNQSLITEINRFSKKEQHSQPKEQSGNSNQTQPGQPVNPASKVEVSTGVGHRQQSHKKAKGRPYSPNQDPMGPREPLPLAAGNENVPVERNFGSGSRRNGRHNNNRSIRGHDNNNARGEWISGHDNRPHNTPSFRDNRQRHNTHYEYQPVGPFKGNNRPEKVDVPVDGADSTYQKHRERGSSQPRRGERQSGYPSHVDSGWE